MSELVSAEVEARGSPESVPSLKQALPSELRPGLPWVHIWLVAFLWFQAYSARLLDVAFFFSSALAWTPSSQT